MRVLPFGDDALLVELDDLVQVRALDDAVRAERAGQRFAEVVDQVPAARTLLLRGVGPVDHARIAAAVEALAARVLVGSGSGGVDLAGRADPGRRDEPVAADSTMAAGPPVTTDSRVAAAHPVAADSAVAAGRTVTADSPVTVDVAAASRGEAVVELPVAYDGPDLDEVAALVGLTVDAVVARHSAATYTVAFGGFMPGFAYLVGLDPVLRVPRRSSPRERVPAGSVAIADEFSAVYPAATPGGWRLLGRCEVALWDVGREQPALLVPGTRVRFVAARR